MAPGALPAMIRPVEPAKLRAHVGSAVWAPIWVEGECLGTVYGPAVRALLAVPGAAFEFDSERLTLVPVRLVAQERVQGVDHGRVHGREVHARRGFAARQLRLLCGLGRDREDVPGVQHLARGA